LSHNGFFLAAAKVRKWSIQVVQVLHFMPYAVSTPNVSADPGSASALATTPDLPAVRAARGPLSLDQRMGIRMAGTFAIHQAREVADFCWREAGATAIFPANGFERRWRDMVTVTQQVQGRMIHFETVGQHLLGLSDASTRFA